jgi:hypothetical protein
MFLWSTVFHGIPYSTWNKIGILVLHEIPENAELLEYVLYSNSDPHTTSRNEYLEGARRAIFKIIDTAGAVQLDWAVNCQHLFSALISRGLQPSGHGR